MKKNRILIVFAILIFSPYFAYAQKADYKIYYDFHSVKDTTTLEGHLPHQYMLYKVGQVSRFIHKDKYYQDSLMAIFLKENPDPSMSGIPMTQEISDIFMSKFHEFRAQYNFKLPSDIRVDKEYNNNYLMIYAQESFPPKWMKDSAQLHWTIFPEKKDYKGYSVQLATTTYGGRNYKAWFTQDIPINDGPFVFSGLPGLIISVEDVQGWFRFEMNTFNFEKTTVYFGGDPYGMRQEMLEYQNFVAWMYKTMTDPEIFMGLLEGGEKLKLKLIDRYKDRFDLLIIR